MNYYRSKKRKRYDFGGVMEDVGMALADSSVGAVTGLFTGGRDISDLSGYEYNNEDVGNVVDTVGEVQQKAMPIVANVLAPGSGAIVSGVQSAGATITDNSGARENNRGYFGYEEGGENAMMYNQLLNTGAQVSGLAMGQSGGANTSVMKYGGKINPSNVQPQNSIAEYEGNTHENGGIPINSNTEMEDGEFKYKEMIFTNRF